MLGSPALARSEVLRRLPSRPSERVLRPKEVEGLRPGQEDRLLRDRRLLTVLARVVDSHGTGSGTDQAQNWADRDTREAP